MLLWIGQIVSQFGNNIHYVALMWWLIDTTGSTIALGTMMIITVLPAVILGPVAGVFVDRMNRKVIIVGMDVIRGIVIGAIGILQIAGTLKLYQLYIATGIVAICGSFFNPAISATIPNLVVRDNLTRANSLSSTTVSLNNIIGPAVGGILIAIFGVGGVFLLNGGSYILSAISESFITMPKKESKGPPNLKVIYTDMKEGLKYIKENRTIFRMLVTFSILNFSCAPLSVLFPAVVKNIFDKGAKELGFLGSAFSLGFLVIGLLLSTFPVKGKKHNHIIWGIAAMGVILGISGRVPDFRTFLTMMAIFGLVNGLVNILLQVFFQEFIPDEKRGRVFGVIQAICMGIMPIGYALGGWLAELMPIWYVFLFAGVACFAGGLFLYSIPKISEI